MKDVKHAEMVVTINDALFVNGKCTIDAHRSSIDEIVIESRKSKSIVKLSMEPRDARRLVRQLKHALKVHDK